MKADTATRQYRSNMAGERVRMTVAEGAEAHIMDILTKMYGDPELACVREYSTNARDSHVEAGQTRPIELTLPTPYLPTLVIRDYGIGLDGEGIMELYSQYGASTKRDTNSAQGMLGIGCKSALAYTDQFTLVGFKDGFRTQVVISRDEDGAATQTIVAVDPTDDPDGVEVTIPVKADNALDEKVRDFFRVWDEGTFKIVKGGNPFPVKRIGTASGGKDEYGNSYRNIWLDDRTLLTNEVDEDLVVMGYVAYPLVDGTEALFDGPKGGRSYNNSTGRYDFAKAYNAVCFVDIGDVNFAPSREMLQNTKRTKDKLAELRKHISDLLDTSIRTQIENATCAQEAQDLLVSGRALGWDDSTHGSGKPAQWQGRDVLLKLHRGKPAANGDGTLYTSGVDDWPSDECLKYSYLFSGITSYTRKAGERGGTLDLKAHTDLTIFVNFDTKWLTNVKRAKLELWASNKGVTVRKIVFVDKLNADEKFWLDGWTIYDWAEVEAVELPKQTTADGGTVRLKGSYQALVDGQYEDIQAAKIDTKKPLYWTQGNRWSGSQHQAIRRGAIKLQGCTLICLPLNRVEKFKRDFPMAKELSDAAKEAATAWAKTIDTDQVKAHTVKEHRAHRVLKALKGEDFDDPTLNTLIRLANTDDKPYRDGMERFGAYVERKTAAQVVKTLESLSTTYPLIQWGDRYGYQPEPSGKALEHLVLYLNAAIAAKKGV